MIIRHKQLSPIGQIWLIVVGLVTAQYAVHSLVYFGFFAKVISEFAFLANGILAVVFSYYFGGRSAINDLILPYSRIPQAKVWLVFAIGWNFPLISLAIPLNDFISGTPVIWDHPHWVGFRAIAESILLFTVVALCDELFWIGFILPRLLAAGYQVNRASLAIGVFWGLSYIPFIFTKILVSRGIAPETLALSWFAMAPIYIWLYCRTSSALAVVLMCVSMQYSNWSLPVLPQPPDYDNGDLNMLNLLTLVAGVALWRLFPAPPPKEQLLVKTAELPVNSALPGGTPNEFFEASARPKVTSGHGH